MRALSFKAGLVLVLAALALTWTRPCTAAFYSDQLNLKLPTGIPADLWAYFIPRDNPLVPAKIELGRQLFFDRRLSADGTISCSSCHDPKLAFIDGKKTAEGIGGRRGTRNTPTILNAMFNSSFFWDGRAGSLEEQAKQPLINPDEMGNSSHEEVVRRVSGIPEYTQQFQRVFGDRVNIDSLAKAIAAYERTLVSADSPYDRFAEGNRNAMTESAQRGFALFRTKARCSVCHSLNQSFPFLTDGNYRNTGVASNSPDFDALSRRAMAVAVDGTGAGMAVLDKHEGRSALGRFLVTGNALDIGAFRTPSLRNVELTPPYFHDGSAATLADVLRFYNKGGNENPNRDWEVQPLNLSPGEQEDLIEFLKALTSEDARRAVNSARSK